VEVFVSRGAITVVPSPPGRRRSAGHQPAVPFNLSNVPVTEGQDIDFIVQSGGNEGDDSLGITATVTESVPEPASLALVGLGSLLLLRRRHA